MCWCQTSARIAHIRGLSEHRPLREDIIQRAGSSSNSTGSSSLENFAEIQADLQRLPQASGVSTLILSRETAKTSLQTSSPRALSQRVPALPTTLLPANILEERQNEHWAGQRQQLLAEFRAHYGKGVLQLPAFMAALQTRGADFARALFQKLDAGRQGFVTDEDLIAALVALQEDSWENRIAFTFELLDVDQCGALSRTALTSLLKPEHTISKDEFVQLLKSNPNLQRSLTSTGASTSLPQGSDAEAGLIKRQTASLSREEQVLVRALHHFRVRRPAKLCWLTLFLLAQAVAFVVGFLKSYNSSNLKIVGWSDPIAKGAAAAIQVTMALILFPVARGLLTFIRSTPLKKAIPVDHSIPVHKILGYCLLAWSLIHSIGQFVNSALETNAAHALNNIAALASFYSTQCHIDAATASLWAHQVFEEAGIPIDGGLSGTDSHPTLSLSAMYRQQVQVTGCLLLAILLTGYLWACKYPRHLKIIEVGWALHGTAAISSLRLLAT
ncbi:hypothetical protein WJX84_002100 [Apatococcus fuscideae]|uniref:EF-hand domain-containing protein n=1 Tax=Apatococcus fuscideae TaxID=2026836 RepID=A0AAW1T2J7_9CHLO